MSWGYKIVAVYVAFVVGIMVMVFKSSNQKIELVTKDYYAKELKYQDRIEEIKRAEKLSAPLSVQTENGKLNLVLPGEFKDKNISGNVELYFAADETQDLSKDFSLKGNDIPVDIKSSMKGQYTIKLQVTSEGVSYYFEKPVFL